MIGEKLDELESKMRTALARQIVHTFKDPLGPLNALTEASTAPVGEGYESNHLNLTMNSITCDYSFQMLLIVKKITRRERRSSENTLSTWLTQQLPWLSPVWSQTRLMLMSL